MADLSKLNTSVDALAVKVAAYIASIPAPVDDQPAVDAVDAKVQAILATIPAA